MAFVLFSWIIHISDNVHRRSKLCVTLIQQLPAWVLRNERSVNFQWEIYFSRNAKLLIEWIHLP